MLAIFTGWGAGLERGSGSVLGKAGLLGSSSLGRGGEQLFLNAANGNLVINRQDEFLVGRGPDVAVARTYNSLADVGDDNGDNWRFGAQRRLHNWTGTVNTAGATVDKVGADGSVITYTYDVGSGAYRATDGAGAYDKIVNTGYWTWTDGDTQAAEIYDSGGTLINLTDTSGNGISYTYHWHNNAWRLSRATTSTGDYHEYVWSGENVSQITTGFTDLATSTAKTLTRARYAYDSSNRLSSVTVDLSPNDNSIADGKSYVTSYTYDGSSRRVASITQTDGSKVEFGYSQVGGSWRITSVKQWIDEKTSRTTGIDYDLTNRITTVTDQAGAALKLVYDTAGRLIQTLDPAPVAGANQIITAYQYDGSGNLAATWRYDGFANLANGITAAQTGYVHDGNGNVIQETDGTGNGIYRTFGAKNELLTEARFGSNLSAAYDLHTTRYVYDGNNRLVYVVSAEGKVTRNWYHSTGELYWVNDFPDHYYNVSGLSWTTPLTDTQLNNWCASLVDTTNSEVVYSFFDARGNMTRKFQSSLNSSYGSLAYAEGYHDERFVYDQAGQLISRQTIGLNTETFVYDGLGRVVASTDLNGATTLTLYRDGTGKVDTVTIPAGGNLVDQTMWPSAGDDARGPNLVNNQFWAGEKRGDNLINLSGWPGDPNSLPSGYATLSAWNNYISYVDETRWAKAVGPGGQEVAVIQAGQVDGSQEGGGNLTNEFTIDASKTYEFTLYFQWTSTSAHRTYFGLSSSGQAMVKNAWDGAENTNPYFSAPLPGEGLQVGRWYKVVGYVLPQGFENVPNSDLGGIFDVETGAKVQDVSNYRWSENRPANTAHIRFFNYYGEGTQGYYTNFYKPEVHELNVTNGNAVVDGWTPYASITDETRWARVAGPDGSKIWAIQAGQIDSSSEGGGGFTNEVLIDGRKTYEFTYYFKKSDLTKHHVYFGVNGWTADSWVKNSWDGSLNNNPYFFSADANWQSQNLNNDRWYKVVGYVFAEGSKPVAWGSAGGIFDTVTGQKVSDVSNFTWNETRPNSQIYSRFFDFYNENQPGYSTYFGRPEIREFDTSVATASGYANVSGWHNWMSDETVWERTIGPDGRPVMAIKAGQSDPSADGGGNYTHEVSIDPTQTYEFSIYFKWTDANAHRTYLGLSSSDPAMVKNAWDGGANVNPYFAYPVLSDGPQVGRWYKIVGYVLPQGSANIAWGSMGGIFDVETGAKVQDVMNFRWNETLPSTSVHARFFNYYSEGLQNLSTYFYGASIRRADDTSGMLLSHQGYVRSDSFNRAGELLSSSDSGRFVTGGTAQYRYDTLGRPRMVTDATGNNSYFLHDKLGRKVADVGADGSFVEYRYDANDRMISRTRYYSQLSAAQLAQVADAGLHVDVASIRPALTGAEEWVWTIYDKDGRILEAIEGDGSVTGYEYDASGQLVRTIAYANKLSAGELSGFKATPPMSVVLPATHADDGVTRNFYNPDGRLGGVLDGEGYLTGILYDNAGRKIHEIVYATATYAPYRASHSFDYLLSTVGGASASDRETRYVYDSQGLLRFTIDGLNRVTEFGYGTGSDVHGPARTTIQYTGTIAALSTYTFASVRAALNAAGLVGHSGNRIGYSVYDAANRLAYSIDALGGLIGYSYDDLGRLAKTVRYYTAIGTSALPSEADVDAWVAAYGASSANRITRNYYSDRDELKFTVDAEGYVTRFDYDAEGRRIGEVRWDAAVSATDNWTINTISGAVGGNSAQTSVVYDALGRVLIGYDALGTATYNWYRGNGQLGSQTVAHGTADATISAFYYDEAGRLIQRLDAYGTAEQTSESYTYDAFGNVIQIADWMSITTRTYDQLGQLLTETRGGSTTSYEYNAFGEVVKTTDGNGNASYTYYDRLGRAVVSRDAESYLTETSYTLFGEVTSVTRRYNQTGASPSTTVIPTAVAHAKDATTSFLYDKLGQVIRTTDAEGHYEEYWYNGFGNRTQVRNKVGGITTFSYNPTGRLYHDYVYAPVHDASGNVVATGYYKNLYVYDARGNVLVHTEAYSLPEQRQTSYVYDKLDRLVTTQRTAVQVLSQADHSSTSSVAPVETFAYDKRGNLIETVAANGARTLSYYDDLDRKVAEIDALGTYTAFTYDGVGNLSSRRVYGTQAALPATAGGSPPAPPGGTNYRETVYTYDALNRLKTTTVANVRIGAWNGSAYATSVGAVTTSFDYDANGNVIKTTDANLNATFSYYDKLGRKTAEVDREGYLTRWAHDADGNALLETRFATRYAGTPSTSAPPSVASHADDRITEFAYDKNGRRTGEWRYNVDTRALDSNGAITGSGTTSYAGYIYNGLGQVTLRIHASGESVTTSYDAAGRLIQEVGNTYADHNGASVTPVIKYYYDGLGSLVRSTQGIYGSSSGERVTTYSYGPGGRLSSMTDAAGGARNYFYDAAGNLLRESYNRLKSDGITTSTDGILYTRDLLGRVTVQRAATLSGSWFGEGQTIAYNAYGEMSHRGLNGLWQEQFDYDAAGRLWRTNEGDGVWRYFVTDKAGNRTLAIEDEGDGLAGLTIDQAIAAATAGGAVGGAYNDGVNVTISVVDRRGLAIETRQPHRQLTAATTQTLITARTYNAYGDVTSETDARGYVTDYKYNTMGRLTEKKSPTVNYTDAAGAVSSARPTETYHYDREGRLIGSRDANGNLTTRRYLAGTGLNGTEGQVTHEYHTDGGVLRNFYDVFGDLRTARNELGGIVAADYDNVAYDADADELRTYDGMGRLLTQTRRGGLLTDSYSYDLLGNRLKHWSNFSQATTGAGEETTDYDAQGRIVSQRAFGGDVTATSYAWDNNIATTGMGATYGGWRETTTYHNCRDSEDVTDRFGRLVSHEDMDGRDTLYSYDMAGRLTARTGGDAQDYSYFNTGRLSRIDGAGSDYAAYGYDANGNKTAEITQRARTTDPNAIVQNATATYDALNRMTGWTEYGAGSTAIASTLTEYDLNGNIRKTRANSQTLDAQGTASAAPQRDQYYLYDTMNRVVRANGDLDAGAIVRGDKGSDFSYDIAGRRMTSTTTGMVSDPSWWWGSMPAEQRETYDYDAAGNLSFVWLASGGYDVNLNPTPPPAGLGDPKASFSYDALGRLKFQTDLHDFDPYVVVGHSRELTYDAKGRVEKEIAHTLQGTDVWRNQIVYDFADGTGYYALGAPTLVVTSNWQNYSGVFDTPEYTTTTFNTYAWFDGAVLDSYDYYKTSTLLSQVDHVLTGSGQLASIGVVDSRPRTITFTNDMTGQVLRRDEQDGNTSDGDPHEIWHRFNGRQMGYVGNNGTLETNYAMSVDARMAAGGIGTGPFRDGASSSTDARDFDLSLRPINSWAQGSAGGGYTVRAGDTLSGIAALLWGDASLWYKLAEANGLSGDAGLTEGRVLNLPSGVTKNTHNASTFRAYDPSEMIGDTNPVGSPAPTPGRAARGNKCGAFGAILLTVVAVAVTAILRVPVTGFVTGLFTGTAAAGTAAAATAATAGAIVGGAAAGIAGSVASQAVGLATGIQDKFSWKGVAMAGISAGITGGIGGGPLIGGAGRFGNDFARGALANALTQGVGVATGLQSKFDFAGVAIGGLVSGIGGAAGRGLTRLGIGRFNGITPSLGDVANMAGSGMAGAIAAGAARSLINGSSFGDNVITALPDVIGSTVGNALAGFATAPRSSPNRVEFASSGTIMSDAPADLVHPEIVVTGTRMNWAQRLGYDTRYLQPHYLLGLAINSTDWRPVGRVYDTVVRAVTDSNPYSVGTRVIGLGLDGLGYHGAANAVRSSGAYVAGALHGGVNVGRDVVVGGVLMAADPGRIPGALLRGTASAIDRVLMANGRDVVNAVTGEAGRSYAQLTSGDSVQARAAGMRHGAAVTTVVSTVAPLGSAARAVTLARGGVSVELATARSAVAAERGLVGGAFDLGVSGPQYTLRAPTIAGFEHAAGTVNTRAFVVHGNSKLSPRTAHLYELWQVSDDGARTFLKYGVSQNPTVRYSRTFMTDKDIIPLTSGSRASMLALERQLVTENPGPLNMESWAVRARLEGRGR